MTPLLLAALTVGFSDDAGGSYLYQPAYVVDYVPRLPARPYCPQPGDIMLATDHGLFWTYAHRLAGTGHPHHSGIVFQKPDGSMGILEAGPYGVWHVRILDALDHLRGYEPRGVWIRQRKTPLTPDQNECLTAFAMRQDGKWFALPRLGRQWTPFRTRGPLRTYWMGQPHGGDRRSYFCSELVTESLVAAGLVDPAKARPSATYPRDLFMDRSLNPFINRNFNLSDCWDPPARWISNPDCDRTVRDMFLGRARPSREHENGAAIENFDRRVK